MSTKDTVTGFEICTYYSKHMQLIRTMVKERRHTCAAERGGTKAELTSERYLG
jgi:hypothetical protein